MDTDHERANFPGGRINMKRTKRATDAPNATVAGAPGDLDGYVTTAEVCYLTGWSRRWLNVVTNKGRWPKPDIPSSGTNTKLWRRSTVRKGLDAMAGIVPVPATTRLDF
jgi:hypothetical protein